jgi:hypothetical protein
MNQELRIIVKADGTATVQGQLQQIGTTATSAKTAATGLNLSLKSIATAILPIAAAAKAFSLLKTTLADAGRFARENEIAVRKLNNALANSGKDVKTASAELQKAASYLQTISNFGDEAILEGVTKELLKFGSISDSIFQRTQRLALDLAEDMGGGEGSLAAASKQLGVALEDPVLGMTRLRRSGVLFTETQQALIKSYVEGGEKAKAQAVVLEALEQKIGGVAQAGIVASKQLKEAYSDFLQSQGIGFKNFTDGMARGLTIYLTYINSMNEITSKTMMESNMMAEKSIANFTAKATNMMAGVVMFTKGLFKVFWSFISDISNAITGVVGNLAKLLNPVNIASGWKNVNFFDYFTIGSETGTAIDSLIANMAKASVASEQIGNSTSDYFDMLLESLKKTTGQIGAIDMGGGETPLPTNVYADEIDIVAKLLAEQKKLINERIKARNELVLQQNAQLAYYSAVGQYSTEHINLLVAQYARELEAYRSLGLSKLQIDEMVNAKRAEIEAQASAERLAKWREQHEIQIAMTETAVNYWANQMTRMVQIQTDSNNKMLNLFAGFINAMIAELGRYIAKLIVANLLKAALDSGGNFFGSLVKGLAGDLLGSKSVSNPMTNVSLGSGGNTQMLSVLNDNITGLRSDLRSSGISVSDQDGNKLMKFIKRQELSYSGAVI